MPSVRERAQKLEASAHGRTEPADFAGPSDVMMHSVKPAENIQGFRKLNRMAPKADVPNAVEPAKFKRTWQHLSASVDAPLGFAPAPAAPAANAQGDKQAGVAASSGAPPPAEEPTKFRTGWSCLPRMATPANFSLPMPAAAPTPRTGKLWRGPLKPVSAEWIALSCEQCPVCLKCCDFKNSAAAKPKCSGCGFRTTRAAWKEHAKEVNIEQPEVEVDPQPRWTLLRAEALEAEAEDSEEVAEVNAEAAGGEDEPAAKRRRFFAEEILASQETMTVKSLEDLLLDHERLVRQQVKEEMEHLLW